jgi:hypothetical protein
VLGSNELNPLPWETNTSPAPALVPVGVPESVWNFNLLQDDGPRWKEKKLGLEIPVVAVATTMAASPETLAIAGGAPNVAPAAVDVQVCVAVPGETMYRVPAPGEVA